MTTCIIQSNATSEVEVIRHKDMSIGIHPGFSVLFWLDENDDPQTRIIDHNTHYVTCM